MSSQSDTPAGIPAARLYGRFLRKYLRPLLGKTVLLLIVFLSAIGLELWLPAIMAGFIDLVAGAGLLADLVRTAGLFLLVGFISQLFTVWENYMATDIGLSVTNRLRSDLALHGLRLDIAFHNRHTPGELIERVDGDPGVLNRFFSTFLVQVVGNIILLLGVLILLFRIDVRIGAALAVFTVTTLAVLGRIGSIGVRLWNESREARAVYFGYIEERLSGTEDIRANGAVAYVMHGLAKRVRAYSRKTLFAEIVASSVFGSTIILFSIGGAIALGLAAWIYLEGTITLGTAYLVVSYSQLMTRPIESLIREMHDLQAAGASLRRVHDLLSVRPSLADGATALAGGPLALHFSNVSFTYEDRDPVQPQTGTPAPHVLQDVSFNLPAGKTLGLLGRTGSGKTTLTRLVFRFFDPQKGYVQLGDVRLQDARLDSLRERIGVVTQEVQLFNASLRDNLTFFDPAIPDARIWEALEALDLRDWVAAFPQGLDTRLQSGGEGFSAGEAQLLAFARVFLKDPGLVILDEASSRLDPATEARLERSIAGLLRGRTAVVIAHRLATVQQTDRIMIMDSGRIAEEGERENLAGDPGSLFSRLMATGISEALVG